MEIILLVYNIRRWVRYVGIFTCYTGLTFIWLSGVATDLLVYSIIIPVMPFQLQNLGYHNVSSLTGWLLFSYVSSQPLLESRI
jgi:hypothetical protein